MPGYDMSHFSPSLVRTLTQHGMDREGNAPITRGHGAKAGPRSKRRYVLVRVDEATGQPLDGHLATDADTEELSALLTVDDITNCPALSMEAEDSDGSECETPTRSVDSRHFVSANGVTAQAPKPGGPCDHCGANGEGTIPSLSIRLYGRRVWASAVAARGCERRGRASRGYWWLRRAERWRTQVPPMRIPRGVLFL
jgi:hypothetical protein